MTQRTSDPVRVLARPATGPRPSPRPSPRAVGAAAGVMSAAALAGVVGLAGGGLDLGPVVTARIPAASPVLAAAALGQAVAVPTIRTFPWLQPACALYGAAVLALAPRLRRSDPAQRAV